MRKQDIEITIGPSGEVSFTVKGVKGARCEDETRFLEDALGGEVVARERTAEYYEADESAGVHRYAGGGEEDD